MFLKSKIGLFKKSLFLYLFLIMGSFAIGQNFDLAGFGYTDGPPVAYFIKFQKGNKIEISWYDAKEQKVKKSYKYQKKYIGRFPLFELDADMPDDLYANLDPKSKEYLGNKFMLLTGLAKKAWKENEDAVIGLGILPAHKGKKASGFFTRFPMGGTGEYPCFNYENVSSYFVEESKEGKREYKIENLSIMEQDTPWVEGADGWGIGESFVIKTQRNNDDKYILLMNGYISASNPKLYDENGRIKKIMVEGVISGKKKEFTVKDTPHPQTIDISFLPKQEDVKVTILDVYKGTKYQDTAIHFMILWRTEVIPYE
ncbi:NADase-type glycan-binding domain-containing protein [Treponema denticola]|uniref:NAD glycohydrolase translocation F5/8 type C domain-containing protein n=1 Tax=Treponema denticola SP33 TaxID=999437 RepID=M2BKR9_TREDN|nr:hypothetical protein [Treponema denticola]EMB22083.1 hypothetical protein HMPREF9733_02420 [Treponema denticola SP33]EPF35796.1 hypothetical protein HMPREF9732_02024 [Treponema denticola SP32]